MYHPYDYVDRQEIRDGGWHLAVMCQCTCAWAWPSFSPPWAAPHTGSYARSTCQPIFFTQSVSARLCMAQRWSWWPRTDQSVVRTGRAILQTWGEYSTLRCYCTLTIVLQRETPYGVARTVQRIRVWAFDNPPLFITTLITSRGRRSALHYHVHSRLLSNAVTTVDRCSIAYMRECLNH